MKATKIRNKKWKLYHRTKNNSDFNSYKEIQLWQLKHCERQEKLWKHLAVNANTNPSSYRYVHSVAKTKHGDILRVHAQ